MPNDDCEVYKLVERDLNLIRCHPVISLSSKSNLFVCLFACLLAFCHSVSAGITTLEIVVECVVGLHPILACNFFGVTDINNEIVGTYTAKNINSLRPVRRKNTVYI